ncbi:MAG: hypothetical protein Q4C59_12170, partial [Lachnospiraceae bacterium]|nr:hypothetical protein [Lachnospiraceae bacterium]
KSARSPLRQCRLHLSSSKHPALCFQSIPLPACTSRPGASAVTFPIADKPELYISNTYPFYRIDGFIRFHQLMDTHYGLYYNNCQAEVEAFPNKSEYSKQISSQIENHLFYRCFFKRFLGNQAIICLFLYTYFRACRCGTNSTWISDFSTLIK